MSDASKTARQVLREAIEARMSSGETFTFGGLWHTHRSADVDSYRLADQTIQAWRKRGWIALSRQSGRSVWTLTEAGREARP